MYTKTVKGKPNIPKNKACICNSNIADMAQKCEGIAPGATPVKTYTKRVK